MLLFMVKPKRYQETNLFIINRSFNQCAHLFIDMSAVLKNLCSARAGNQTPNRPFIHFTDRVVIGIEKEIPAFAEHLVISLLR